MAKSGANQFVVCIENEGHSVSLQKGTHYLVVRDPAAARHGLLRVIDESGEDYFHPNQLFRQVGRSRSFQRAPRGGRPPKPVPLRAR
jgi:hypothetical protein